MYLDNFTVRPTGDIENTQVSENVVISYNPASKLVLFQAGAFAKITTSPFLQISFRYYKISQIALNSRYVDVITRF
jgi:hypothetical protein